MTRKPFSRLLAAQVSYPHCLQPSLSVDPAGNEIPVVAMETVPTVHLTMDIDMDDGTMGMDMIGAVNCAAMAGAAANAHAISVLVV